LHVASNGKEKKIMNHTSEKHLLKQASATAFRRQLGVIAPSVTTAALGKSELLRRGLACQFDRATGGTEASHFQKRRSVDRVPVGDGKFATIDHDIEDDGIVIAGVATDLNSLPVDLRSRFESAVDRFQAADDDLAAQARAREAVARIVREVLTRDKFLNATVKERIRAHARSR
jgi:hypothetical protein